MVEEYASATDYAINTDVYAVHDPDFRQSEKDWYSFVGQVQLGAVNYRDSSATKQSPCLLVGIVFNRIENDA